MLYLTGNILYMKDRKTLCTQENGCLAIDEDGRVAGVYSGEEFAKQITVREGDTQVDYGDRLLIPGMTDLHVHAPQYAFRGLGMDLQLLEWLEGFAFPEEMRYAETEYAGRAYQIFAEDLRRSVTTRACVFATVHLESSLLLADLLDQSGVITYVGKVNMDRMGPEELCENVQDSIDDTVRFVEETVRRCSYTKPMITPRFAVSCSDELMRKLGDLRRRYNLPVQSHLSENRQEIEKIRELYPNTKFYGEAYDQNDLFGDGYPAVMAHCVYSSPQEIERMLERGVYIAHCPNSNFSLSSGMAPVRDYWEQGLNIGLGTDVAGGFSLSMLRAIQDTVTVSKLYQACMDEHAEHLSVWEAFYLATMGGGSFFGKVGSFLPGYDADVLVLDDSNLLCPVERSLEERLERLIYLAESDALCAKYVKGRMIYQASS